MPTSSMHCRYTFLQASIDEVNNALLRHKLPFGAKAAEPRPLDTYTFSHDGKVSMRRRTNSWSLGFRARPPLSQLQLLT